MSPLPLPLHDGENTQAIFDLLAQQFPINAPNSAYPVVTSLPSGSGIPNGMVIHYLADSTNGVVWQLKYRSASASSFKWEFVGGSPLTSETTNAADETTASTAYTTLTTAGPSVTVPLAGDYLVEHAFTGNGNTVGMQLYMSYAIGAAAAVDADAAGIGVASVGNDLHHARRTRVKTGLAATTALAARYRVTAGTGTWRGLTAGHARWMSVTPVRVG